MKKNRVLITSLLAVGLLLSGCQKKDNEKVITISASEIPHAKILRECINDIVKEDGYTLKVTVLDWKVQNNALVHKEYDANYFQHVPYLLGDTNGSKLFVACKVHYEKLCLYSSKLNSNKVENGNIVNNSKIEIIDDPTNLERSLKLLEQKGILTINESNYDSEGKFSNFNITKPNSCVTFSEAYNKCSLTCVNESQMVQSLPDYDFAIIPGNTALTGLGKDYASRIVFGEDVSEEALSKNANIICTRKEDRESPKTLELVKAFQDQRVKSYIENTFGESVLYHFENGLTTDLTAI